MLDERNEIINNLPIGQGSIYLALEKAEEVIIKRFKNHDRIKTFQKDGERAIFKLDRKYEKLDKEILKQIHSLRKQGKCIIIN